ncbi:MAG: hypothetical protein WD673_00790 [Alphaproteobacteria bacterium]
MEMRLTWQGREVVVASSEPGTELFLRRYLWCPVSSAGAEATPDVRVAREGTGYRVSYPDGALRVRSAAAAKLALLESIAYVLATGHHETILHAGAYVGPKGAVVILGAPRAGKSYLAYGAWRAGRVVLGDDRVVWSDAAVQAFPKCLKLRIESRSGFAAIAQGIESRSRFAASLAGDRRLVLARALAGFAPYGERVPVRALVVVERGAGARSRLGHIAAPAALARLMGVAGPGLASPMDFVRVLKRHAGGGQLPLLTVGSGDAPRALDLLDRL